jgi:SAM-dependent methyltransferase
VDFSAHSLAHAREEARRLGLSVDYREADYLEMELEGGFDLILLIFGDFCPLSPAQRSRLLARVARWLAPGGRFVFDVTSLSHFRTMEEESEYQWVPEGGFWSPEEHFLFRNRFVYPEERVYLDRFTVVEEARRREIFNWIQCFSPETLEAELARAGFEMEAYPGNLAGDDFDPETVFFGAVARLE